MKLIGKLYVLMILLLCFVGKEVIAQTRPVVSGVVTELIGNMKEPLVGVNVTVVNSQNRTLSGTITNLNGQYNLKIPTDEKNLTIVYSYIGMKSKRIKYTGQKALNVQLDSDVSQVDEVVVEASRIERSDMGISQLEQVSATQKIQMDELVATSPVSSVEEVLQGQLAGVDIMTGGGDPGTRSTINIRGISTLNGAIDPLIVIDGVPTNTNIGDDFDFATANEEDLGALLSISPSDIESVEVLKDASATAIWGTRGANGVLVIKTKKGKIGKISFNFSSKFTANVQPSTIPMLNGNEYTALMNEAIWNSANYVGVSNAESYLRLLFDTPEIGYQPNWKYFDEFNQNTDWLEDVSRTAYTWENNFSMTGGGEKATYRFSLGYLTDNGTTIGTSLKRLNTMMRVDYRFSNKLKFGADFAFTQADRDANWTSNVRSVAFSKMPNKSPYVMGDNGERTEDYFTYQTNDWEGLFTGSNSSNYNPVAMVNEATNHVQQRSGKFTFRMDYKILPGLTYNGWVSINMSSTKSDKFLPQIVTGVAWTSQYANMSSEGYSEGLSIQTENRLNYLKRWNENKHQLIATLVYRTSQSTSSSYASATSGMASSSMSDPVIGTSVQSMGSGESEGRSLSGVALLNYTLMQRYVFHSALNIESSSAMGRNKRMAYFPSAGISWNIQNEPFLESVHESWLTEAKLRFGVGQSGAAPKGNSVYLGAFEAKDNYINMPSIVPKRMQLDKLKWQTSTEYNYGADFGFFNNRLRLTFDYYRKYTKDLLQPKVGIPSSTGYSTVAYINSGKMQNEGWELRADAVFFQNKDWRVSGYVNVARNKNRITELPINMNEESGVAESDADLQNGKYAARAVVGQPFGAFYGFRYKGVYQNKDATYARDVNGGIMNDINGNPIIMKNGIYNCYPGDAMYEDINHDGVINKYDMVYLGNSQPLVTGGAGISVKYKQVSLNAFFHGRFGQSIVNIARMNNESMYGKSNQSTAVLRRWKKEGDQTDIPRALYNEGRNFLGSDRFVEDASFLRLKTLTLNYAFPRKLCQRWGFNTLSIFATGYNLITWTNYTGQDPEVRTPGTVYQLAADGATTPCSIRFSFGVNMNF